MADSHDTDLARRQLRCAFAALDEELSRVGCERPSSATIREHLHALTALAGLAELDFGPAAAGYELLYSPDADAPGLMAAAHEIEALREAIAELYDRKGALCPEQQTAQPSGTVESVEASSAAESGREVTEELFGPAEGSNPQLSTGVVARSSPGIRRLATLLIGVIVVCVTVGIALWGKRGRDADPYRLDIPAEDLTEHFRTVLHKRPRDLEAHRWLASYAYRNRHYGSAVYHYEWLIKLNPRDAEALNSLAWLLLTASKKKFRDPTRALPLAERAAAASKRRKPHILDTLAVAHFQLDQKDKAISIIQEALALELKPRESEYYRRREEKFMSETPPGVWHGRD